MTRSLIPTFDSAVKRTESAFCLVIADERISFMTNLVRRFRRTSESIVFWDSKTSLRKSPTCSKVSTSLLGTIPSIDIAFASMIFIWSCIVIFPRA